MPTIIGDIHGKYDEYLNIAKNCKSTVQLGDFGFNWSVLDQLDHHYHKVIGGNHDNYDIVGNFPHYLGDFGTASVEGLEFFYVRGERSVDAHLRTEGVSWWRNEELSMAESYAAIEAYCAAKPQLVITHGCPSSIIPFVCTNPAKHHPSRTAQMLEAMFENHRPKLWVFGHHHKSESFHVMPTKFICLNELDTLTIDL